jgi:hypothetical protein
MKYIIIEFGLIGGIPWINLITGIGKIKKNRALTLMQN